MTTLRRLPADFRNTRHWITMQYRIVRRFAETVERRHWLHTRFRDLGYQALDAEAARGLDVWRHLHEATVRVDESNTKLAEREARIEEAKACLDKERTRLSDALVALRAAQPDLDKAARAARQDALVSALRQRAASAPGSGAAVTGDANLAVQEAAAAATANRMAIVSARAEWRGIRAAWRQEMGQREAAADEVRHERDQRLRHKAAAGRKLGRSVYDAGQMEAIGVDVEARREITEAVEAVRTSDADIATARRAAAGQGIAAFRSVAAVAALILLTTLVIRLWPTPQPQVVETIKTEEIQRRAEAQRKVESLLSEPEKDLLNDTGLQLE
jgi:hypothetical protein